MTPLSVMYGLWDLWAVSWVAAAVWSARASVRAPVWSEAWRDLIGVMGAAVLWNLSSPEVVTGTTAVARVRALLLSPIWRLPSAPAWALVAVTAAGFAFCWWARLHLGRLWSGFVGRKAEHRIVETGPYRLVRHPIYTGLLTSALAMALLKGTPAALGAFGLLTLSLVFKARLEERFLGRELGPATYGAYQRRTPMLLPAPWRRV